MEILCNARTWKKRIMICYIISQTMSHKFDFVAKYGARGLFMLPQSKEIHV